ncbi:MAG: AMP-binding protein [Desulfovibrionaceae bacterium]|nr:AMP-binding protein [Desulfovibrionaceae bacterium]
MLDRLVRALLRLVYRVEIRGREHYAAAGERVLIVINPGSLLDPLFIGALLPDRITLAVDRAVARKWWMRPILALTDTIQVDFSSPTSTLSLVRAIEKHKRCMVFHGGRFQNDPRFMRILEATGLIAEKARATLLPIRIDGAAYSRFSYFRHKVRLHWFPKVTLTVLPPQKLEAPANLPPRQRRHRTAVQLYGLMTDLLYGSTNIDRNLIQVIMDAVAVYGRSYLIAEDQDRHVLSYGGLLTRFQVLGRALGRVFAGEERVGFMLPSSLPGVVAFLGLHVTGKVPAMINFTAGAAPVLSGCHTVGLTSVLSSRKFIELGDLRALENSLREAGLRMVYLEDVAADLRIGDKIGGLLAAFLRRAPRTPADAPAAILFTSGTEGAPKAVFMSHRNVNANREQMLAIVNVNAGDRLFNCLPMFHTFGLGIGTLLPLSSGMRVFLYPSPLHYRIVPRLFYESLSTVICGTDTFFSGYARYGSPYDFFNARLVIAGGEKMRESTAALWEKKYGVRMVEGYGATETSPVISVNTPANNKAGSVGRLAPGMSWRLRPVPGLSGEEGENVGDLWVKGDNVMLGYMRAEAPGVLEPPVDADAPSSCGEDNGAGWYNTGDIVCVDAENFIFIKGRAKRFAKVGGEMVSLAAVENALRELWPEAPLCVVAVPDARKGEQLVLLIENGAATMGRIAAAFAARGLSPLWTPRRILNVQQIPVLGTGKFDYMAAKRMALESAAD